MSLYNIISTIKLDIGSREMMYKNIKNISNYIDTPKGLSTVKKDEMIKIINGIKSYLLDTNNIKLDNEQIKIIESEKNNNYRIIAGAGSGKTTTILYRIKYLLNNFITPDRILILTFNRDSAQNIRNKIKDIFNFPVYIKIYTIDAFCCKLFNKYECINDLYSINEYCKLGLKIIKKYSKELSEQFKYIFFDEFQDVNDTQFKILKILVDNGSYLTVIGDDCQNIYQFRGTNNYYIINFDRIIPNSKTFFLYNNYRSTNNIVLMANKSISYNKIQVSKVMKAININSSINPKLFIYNKECNIYSHIIDKINSLIINGEKYDDICILSRNSYPLKIIETELTKKSIPHNALITDKNSEENKKLIEPNKVIITTIHKSKGLEWKYVFIIGLSHQHFPEHLNNNIKNIEEERRLFYVGITRTKEFLEFISCSSELPLSIFLKETQDHLTIINNTDNIDNIMPSNMITATTLKEIYGVNETISLLNENDLDKMRELNLLPKLEMKMDIIYDKKINFIDEIKKNSFEPEIGEYVDRYITRGIIKNLDIDFIDIDTESILNNNMIYDIKNININKAFTYPLNIIEQIEKSYNKLKNNNLSNEKLMNDIYWVSLCRNFRLERRRLVYRDIYNLIEENILLIQDRMNNYINIYSNKRNIKCKVLVSNKINNKTIIIGEIDLIDNDTIVDFKCSESEFKLEWLLQLLFYYSLYEKERKKKDEITLETSSSSLKLEDQKKNKLKKIKKLKIINIMYGYEYTIDISELKYNYIDLINYIEYKIKCDQLNIRNFETLSFSYNLLDNKNNNIKQKEILDPIVFNKNNTNDYYMILDTETGELNEDIIQLSYLLVDKNNNIIKQVDKYVKNRLPSVKTIEIHNINTYYLRENGIEFYDIIKEFIDDLSKVSYIVGHNVNYDLRVIQNDIRKYELIILKNNKYNYDIFEEIQIIDTYHKTNKSLEKLYIELFDKPFDNAHNSLNDVIATYECYKKLFL